MAEKQYSVNNDMFEHYSWYFRNALVRANYRNVQKGINAEPIFLVRFFRNLLLGETNELKNRYMLVNPPEEWNTPTSSPISTPTSSAYDMLQTENPLIRNLVKVIGNQGTGTGNQGNWSLSHKNMLPLKRIAFLGNNE